MAGWNFHPGTDMPVRGQNLPTDRADLRFRGHRAIREQARLVSANIGMF